MERSAVIALLSLSATAALLLLAAAGGVVDACGDYDVPSMSAAAACQKASRGQAMSQLCADALGTATAPDEDVTVFVLAAVNAAANSNTATVGYVRYLAQDPAAPGAARAAGNVCVGKYGEAQQQMSAAVGHLNGCELAELIRDVPAAVAAVDDCAIALLPEFDVNSPLYSTVIDDRDRSMLALRLTKEINTTIIMEKAAAAALSLLSLSLTAASLLAGGVDACDGAPRMSAVDACKQASTAGVMWQLCVRTLGASPEPEEVTGFVAAAMLANRASYVISYDAAEKVRVDPSAPADLARVCGYCEGKYDTAQELMTGWIDRLPGCDITADIRVDLATAAAAVDECATLLLQNGGEHTPLYRMREDSSGKKKMMNRADATVFLLAMALFLAGAAVVVVVDACDGVPSMSLEDVCQKAFGTAAAAPTDACGAPPCIPPMHVFCVSVLQERAPDAGEVTVFAVAAAKYAKESYEATMEAAFRTLQNASLPGDERAACAACRDTYYAQARSSTIGAMNLLVECSFGQLSGEYAAAADAIKACRDAQSKLQSPALYGLAVSDLMVAALASGLGELVTAKHVHSISSSSTLEKAMNTMLITLGLLVLIAVSLTVAVAGDETTCPGAPAMTVETACRNVSGTQAMYDTCKDALAGVPDPMSDHDATVYALAAAHGALSSADATLDAATQLFTYNTSLSDEEKDAYKGCMESYAMALHAMGDVLKKLGDCNFRGSGIGDDYMNGLLDVESCRDRVLKLPASPLYAMQFGE
uniref:Pectinesterase inhibitor domain-containing protein n=1 Tax=Oryza punctata TaxID=4537 RepID=A0A0E0LR46_ORYPU